MKLQFDNIVLISIDALRYDCVKYQKRKLIRKESLEKYLQTPTLNKLARNAICFTNAFSNAPYTTSAHAGLFAGTYPKIHGIRQMYYKGERLNPRIVALAEHFRNEKYNTIALSNPILLEIFDKLELTRGFNHTFSKDSEFAEFFIKDRSKKKFIFLHLFDVHAPYLYSESDIFVDNSDYYAETEKLVMRHGVKFHDRFWNRKPFEIWRKLSRKVFWKRKVLLPLYLRGVSKFDQGRFRALYDLLSKQLNMERTIVFIFSDHGEGACDYFDPDAFGHSMHMANDVIRVPIMIHNPKINHTINNSLTSLMDLHKIIRKCSKPIFLQELKEPDISSKTVYSESWYYVNPRRKPQLKLSLRKKDYYLLERMIIKKGRKIILSFSPEKIIDKIEKFTLNRKSIGTFMKNLLYHNKWPSRQARYLLYVLAKLPLFGNEIALRILLSKKRYPIIFYSRLNSNMEEVETITDIKSLNAKQLNEVIEGIDEIFKINKLKIKKNKILKFMKLLQ